MSGWVGKELVYPSNVLMVDNESALYAWFIKLFSQSGDSIANPLTDPVITTTALSLGRDVCSLATGVYQLSLLS